MMWTIEIKSAFFEDDKLTKELYFTDMIVTKVSGR